MAVRVVCDACNEQAIIRSSAAMSPHVRELFCICSNVHCGHTFVVHQLFARTISPSLLSMPPAVKEKLGLLQVQQQSTLFESLR